MKFYTFSTYLFLAISCLSATEERQLVNQLALGPEIYYVQRSKEGGTRQGGTLYGARLSYHRIKRCGWYLGGDALYATGTLSGKSGADDTIRSTFTDKYVEGRVGYTFQQKCGYELAFTPFLGYGYFWETNNFRSPSPITVHFENQFSYVPVGFLSHMYLNDNLGLGLNFTTRFLLEHEIKVTHDELFGDGELHYKEKNQYRVELPITYDFCFYERLWRVSFEPFFEYRQYGHLANFPFDFLETKFRVYGANLQLVLLF